MIKIVTDSSAYFTKSEALKHNIKVIPLHYRADGRELDESFADQNGDFETLLRGNSRFATSHPGMEAFLSCFEEETRDGDEVLCITISSRLSGTFGTAFMAAKQSGRQERIAVFDSLLTGGGLNLLIKKANELIAKGLSLKEIMKALPDIRDRITIAFSVDDMTPLRNSGRLGFVRMSISTILNIKPILLCQDGAVVSDGTARGQAEIIKRLASKAGSNTEEVVISYIGVNRMATNLYTVIKNMYPGVTIRLQKIGPVLGIHLGLSVVAVSCITKGALK